MSRPRRIRLSAFVAKHGLGRTSEPIREQSGLGGATPLYRVRFRKGGAEHVYEGLSGATGTDDPQAIALGALSLLVFSAGPVLAASSEREYVDWRAAPGTKRETGRHYRAVQTHWAGLTALVGEAAMEELLERVDYVSLD